MSVFAVPRSTAISRPTRFDNDERDAIEFDNDDENEEKRFPAMR
jgi:hypothetical protein